MLVPLGGHDIPEWMDELACEVATKHGREVVDVDGNFEETRFRVDRAFTLEELDEEIAS